MTSRQNSNGLATVFPTDLGWIAIAWRANRILQLTFGHQDPQTALQKIAERGTDPAEPDVYLRKLKKRLCKYAQGTRGDDFLDVELDTTGMTPFQRSVTHQCRRIRAGETLSYGQLADRAGHPGAARAVGRVMSCNRFPLIVPCHRVVAAASLGGFSSPDGLEMKRRLLAPESESSQHRRVRKP